MQWTDVINDPCLRDLPYKIELNRWGNIEMSPASNKHGIYQAHLSSLLLNRMTVGEVISECSIQTPEGVKVPDVAWCSSEFLQRHGFETPYSEAPELCVEILSPSNSPWEFLEKIQIYLAAGAREAWLVGEDGKIAFYDRSGAIAISSFNVDTEDLIAGLRL
jgi:Uma2 family endonuclease